jgi:hypothetical protein
MTPTPVFVRTRPPSRRLATLFGATLFLSAFLMFLIEPMIAKMVLPLLGGAPSVWNTCLVFFQAVLLAGYAYAHGAARLGVRRHAALHGLVILVPLFVLPIGLARVSEPSATHPAAWLLLALLTTVGLPFFALSTSAAVLQTWFSRTDDAAAPDPYFLYAASNLGSFVALLAYPLIVEPTLRLPQQSAGWTIGYVAFVVLTLTCATAIWHRGQRPLVATMAESLAEAIGWGRRLRWLALAFAPSSLLLAVTSYIATDVASVPLLWVGPLSIYLMTFVVAFSPSAERVRRLARRFMPLAVIVLTIALVAQMNQPLSYVIPVHLVTFAIVALFCHGELARDRPPAAHLTVFYLWIALGGMLGGLFNALLAPALFVGVAEYPLVLALACALRKPELSTPSTDGARRPWLADIAFAAAVGSVAAAVVLVNNRLGSESRLLILGVGVPAVVGFGQQRRPFRFFACVAALLLAGSLVQSAFGRSIYAARTFFGIYRVRLDDRRHFRFMFHGSTLHGMQSTLPARRHEALSYYYRTGPIGQVFDEVPIASQTSEVAVVGLGVGSLATYAQPGQHWTFYEIDPEVEHIARNAEYFTYLEDCGPKCVVTIGDARLSMARARPEQYGLIVLDAFSSDAIPIHLLTREAMAVYLSRLAPGGVIAFHISNLHLSLSEVLARVAADQGLAALVEEEAPNAGSLSLGKFPSQWMVVAKDPRDFGSVAADRRWQRPEVSATTPLWTDDFSNILSVLRH